MTRRGFSALLSAVGVFFASGALAHDAPTSFIDLHAEEQGINVDLTASTTDLAHDFSEIEPGMLLQPAVLEKERRALSVIILSRLTIAADGKRLLGEPANIKALVEK